MASCVQDIQNISGILRLICQSNGISYNHDYIKLGLTKGRNESRFFRKKLKNSKFSKKETLE